MQSALLAVQGVSNVAITMPDYVVVTANEEVKVSDLIKAIESAGYSATEG